MKLTGKNCALEFDKNGRAVMLENYLTGERYALSDGGEYLRSEETVYESGECRAVKENGGSIEFAYDGFRVLWVCRGTYFEKTVYFCAPRDMTAEQMGVLSLSFEGAREIRFHDDCTIWHCPLCRFARYGSGGAYSGLAYPYWDEGSGLSFSPWISLAAGEVLESEKAFVGVFANTGKKLSTHGPYPGKRKQRYTDMFLPDNSGLKQHFADGVIPDDVGIPEEELDTGEVAAMRDFFREYLGENPLPEEGYFVWQNGWWAGLSSADTECIDVLAHAGVHDIMTAAMYYGHAAHPSCEPVYIKDVRPQPLGFPASEGTAAKVATLDDGHHSVISEDNGVQCGEYTDTFSAPPEYERLIGYGRERGVYVSSFSTPDNSYALRPQWLSLNSLGEPYRYLGTRLSCPACREYMEHHFRVICSVFDRYRPRFWGFDGRWMGYREFAGYGYGTVGEDPCFAEDHGHFPGKSRYAEWKNIEEFKRKLRERYPDMCLEQYYGLKRGSTWSLKYLNCDENYYECSCADDNRFQTWHNENDRFRPTYMNYAPIFGGDAKEFEYSVISALSTSSYAQLARGYQSLRDSEECVGILKKWRSWAAENSRFLRDRVTLFGCPGDVAVDASAHIVDGEGWVFFFCTVDRDETVRLELSDIPGLDSCAYRAELIHPEAKPVQIQDGAAQITVEAHGAAVLHLIRA